MKEESQLTDASPGIAQYLLIFMTTLLRLITFKLNKDPVRPGRKQARRWEIWLKTEQHKIRIDWTSRNKILVDNEYLQVHIAVGQQKCSCHIEGS